MPAASCGCYYLATPTLPYQPVEKRYLPLVSSSFHSSILSTTSRTTLTQIFTNPSPSELVRECIYNFPLYDGVSVVKFTCRIGEDVLHGIVRGKGEAKAIFDAAVAVGETAALLEHAPQAADIFRIMLGNIPAGGKVVVEITYIGELKAHRSDGVRFTIPTSIAPRYGSGPITAATENSPHEAQSDGGIRILVDVDMPNGSPITELQSPSHPIAVSVGTLSTDTEAEPSMSKASATLSLGTAALEKDFVLIIQVKDIGAPRVILETHPTIPNHRAIMATLVPKFALPTFHPEIVLVADRSGSMQGNIPMLVSALKVFLKSMPPGVKFNICSFGTDFSFLWSKSQSYTPETLDEATRHVGTFAADLGGTEMFRAIKATLTRRLSDLPLEVMLLTDGGISEPDRFFTYINEMVKISQGSIRMFSLGIGDGVSHSLIEGVARAGNGFAQAVQVGEPLDNDIVRMLRGALSPHIMDYSLEVKYEQDDDEFEVIDKVTDGMETLLSGSMEPDSPPKSSDSKKPTISLYDATNILERDLRTSQAPTLPIIPPPKILQAPHNISSLFPFSRTSVYLLLSAETYPRNPIAVILRATSAHGPLALEIPIDILPSPQDTIHKLAARKAMQDLEEGRSWIHNAKDQKGTLIKDIYPRHFQGLVTKEAVRLGEMFQTTGRWCTFVAVSASGKEVSERRVGDNTNAYSSSNPETPKVPVRGYRGSFSMGSFGASSKAQSQMSTNQKQSMSVASSVPRGGCYDRVSQRRQRPHSAAPAAATTSKLLENLHGIIALQNFDGSWPVDKPKIYEILGFDAGENPLGGSKEPWVTVVVVCFLETKLADEQDTWGLVVEKAKTWLMEAVGAGLEDLRKEAAKLVDRA